MKVETAAVALLFATSSLAAPRARLSEKTLKEDPDFGLCIPTMKFEGGLGGRSAGDFTFLPTDPLCARGQQEALNPNIITNRICDQLSTACNANEAAKELCRDAQAKIRTLGTRNKSTADTWNTLLGFGGALTNPDGGLSEPGFRSKDLKIKREEVTTIERRFIECRTDVWLDDCNGWSAPEPVVKREVIEPAPEPVVKREAEPEPEPEAAPTPAAEPAVVKRDVEAAPVENKAKRAIENFVECSTDVWLDNCNGWP
ncbi:hypothetical protein PV08_04851 [Exophiala spinifera]|uniref:Uncharacterized protein n=1 Tax=Exophiala spinifera TaxID=91928 RepID=A0A0D1YQZ6_9EURO|nr:uncharacterized protein PV08_04851 [Exophiala spinifera]KIW17656.1 hypothetical protein PV08_04851 [Exophiala spinifera]